MVYNKQSYEAIKRYREKNREAYNERQRKYNLKKKYCKYCKKSYNTTYWAKH